MKPCVKCGSTDRYASGDCRNCASAYRLLNRDRRKEKYKEWYALNGARRARERRIENPEKAKKNDALWRNTNPEKRSASFKAWSVKNKGHQSDRYNQWVSDHPGMVQFYDARRQALYPEKINVKTARRRAAKIQATPAWANEFFISEAYRLAKLRERVCGGEWHVDHIVPLRSKSVCGLHVENNLQVVPKSVNLAKGNRHWPNQP